LTLPLIVPSASIVRETVSAYGINLPYIIYPANFWPHKNHYHLLLAIKELKDQGLLLGLVLTGKKQGTYKSIYKLSIELGLDTQIYFTGLVDSTTLQALYVGSNGLCYPSLFGPDNLPPLEALALGVPVATADVPGAREQLNDQVLFFNPCSPSEISSSIRIMLDNPRICHTSRSSQQDLKNSLSSYVIRVIEQIEILAPYITCAHICRLTST
jgi:glycosyltransferase involved in cell wall biosynthesis